MTSLSIATSGLMVNQRLLDLTGENIANASTPGYHRQVAVLAPLVSGNQGSGVQIEQLTRVIDPLLENAVTRNTVASTGNQALLTGLNQIQSYLAPGSGSLNDLLNNFYNAAETLTTQPDDLTQRGAVVSAASSLATQLNNSVDQLNQFSSDTTDQAKTTVQQINALTTQIAQLNQKARDGVLGSQSTNEILDMRDQAVTQLSGLIDVRVVPQDYGQVNVIAGGVPVVLGTAAIPLSVGKDANNQLIVTPNGSQQAMNVTGGQLAGLMQLTNTILPSVQSQFNEFAQGLVTQLDDIHATGLGLNGPMTNLTSQRPVADPAAPLGAANLAYPPQAGDLYVTVTNLSTGDRSLQKISFDPATQNLASLANSLSTIPHLNAVANSQNGTLSILAQPGYGFDFTGTLSTQPDTQAITGTTTASIAGAYTGTTNDTLQFDFVGSGTIGASPNLALEVRNGAGTLLNSVNVGLGYEAGTSINAALGVNVSLAAGTVNDGDSFQVNVAANPDTAKLLPALGLNTLFVGDSAGGLQVRPDLVADPSRLALSTTGQPGDGTNLAKLIASGNVNALDGNQQTFSQFLGNLIGNVGTQTQTAQTQQNAYDALGATLSAQQQSVSGVDPNEELMNLVNYQRAYQMSARFVSAINDTLNQLFLIVPPS